MAHRLGPGPRPLNQLRPRAEKPGSGPDFPDAANPYLTPISYRTAAPGVCFAARTLCSLSAAGVQPGLNATTRA